MAFAVVVRHDRRTMTFISITRLRLRAWRFLPQFAFYATRANVQVRRARGFVGGELLNDRAWTFWTMTAWNERADMRGYIASGAHLTAMPKLLHWCDEASIVHWEQEGHDLPTWDEADCRMRAEGRASKVRHPTVDHAGLRYRTPRTTGAVPLVPLVPRQSPE